MRFEKGMHFALDERDRAFWIKSAHSEAFLYSFSVQGAGFVLHGSE
jgi:hypothetical protein